MHTSLLYKTLLTSLFKSGLYLKLANGEMISCIEEKKQEEKEEWPI